MYAVQSIYSLLELLFSERNSGKNNIFPFGSETDERKLATLSKSIGMLVQVVKKSISSPPPKSKFPTEKEILL